MITTLPDKSCFSFHSEFLPVPLLHITANTSHTWWYHGNSSAFKPRKSSMSVSPITCTSNPLKIRRDPSLDKHVVKQNKMRFVQKLKTLLLSKPRHFMPLHVLNKCKSYLSLSKHRSILHMVYRYPTIFEVFSIPTPHLPLNATKPPNQLCIRLTPAAAELARKEIELKKAMSDALAVKLQKLLMLATHHRLLLYKLVHLAPDLGLPINFHSFLCNKYPERFKLVQSCYGHALELVKWDANLADKFPKRETALDLIVDRPLKFKHMRLRKGLNIKRRHQEFLMKFEELPDVCPYKTKVDDLVKESLEAEKRACAVVREVLGMTIEKRTLVDHLTHFRKDFGLPNKLRGMLVRHPDLFYVSLKGQRDSVFLVEGYDDEGVLLEKDGMLVIRDQLLQLVKNGHKMRKEKRNNYSKNDSFTDQQSHSNLDDKDDEDYGEDDDIDSLDELFESDDFQFVDDANDYERTQMEGQFWTTNAISFVENDGEGGIRPW